MLYLVRTIDFFHTLKSRLDSDKVVEYQTQFKANKMPYNLRRSEKAQDQQKLPDYEDESDGKFLE